MIFHKIFSYKKQLKNWKRNFSNSISKIECLGINQWNILAYGAVDTTVMEEVMEEF